MTGQEHRGRCGVKGGNNTSGFCSLRSLEEECDDGDLLDVDGCSRKCKKEKGFNCVGEYNWIETGPNGLTPFEAGAKTVHYSHCSLEQRAMHLITAEPGFAAGVIQGSCGGKTSRLMRQQISYNERAV